MKKLLALLLIFAMLLSMGISGAETAYKEESIYSILNEDGSVNRLYVVNALHGERTDYGTYKEVENLTSLDEIIIDGDKISLPDYEGTFYYQGTLDQTLLPWEFTIIYKLDGNEVSASELAGADGELTIQIGIRQGDANKDTFYNNFALQVGLTLAASLSQDVKADGATVVEAGGNKQIAFIVLPGSDSDLTVTANVTDFEMEAITINAVNMVFDMDIDTSVFTGQLRELSSAIAGLDEGAKGILDGLTQLSEGLSDYTDGMMAYEYGINQYTDGGASLSYGLKETARGLSQLTEQNEQLKTGLLGMEQAAFDQVNEQLLGMGLTLPSLTIDNYQVILGGQEALQPLLIQLTQTLQLTGGLTSYMDGVDQLADGTSQLSLGLEEYVAGGIVLADSAKELYDGAAELNLGLSALREGMATYQEGTDTFKQSTGNMDEDINGQIDMMLGNFLGDDSETVSFVSDKNLSTASVQFFFRTEPIAVAKMVEPLITKEEDTSIWYKIIHLFDWVGELFN